MNHVMKTSSEASIRTRRSPAGRARVTATGPSDYLRWRTEVVAILRQDFDEVLNGLTEDDVDWPAWQCYFTAGKSARAAVERALERDL